jgi:hypothetical protein
MAGLVYIFLGFALISGAFCIAWFGIDKESKITSPPFIFTALLLGLGFWLAFIGFSL